MSAEIIDLGTRRAPTTKRQKKRWAATGRNAVEATATTLIWQAQQTRRLLSTAAAEALKDGDYKRLGVLLQMADRQLERGIQAHTDNAKRDFRRAVQDACGPEATCGEFMGKRNVLALILKSLPDLPE